MYVATPDTIMNFHLKNCSSLAIIAACNCIAGISTVGFMLTSKLFATHGRAVQCRLAF